MKTRVLKVLETAVLMLGLVRVSLWGVEFVASHL